MVKNKRTALLRFLLISGVAGILGFSSSELGAGGAERGNVDRTVVNAVPGKSVQPIYLHFFSVTSGVTNRRGRDVLLEPARLFSCPVDLSQDIRIVHWRRPKLTGRVWQYGESYSAKLMAFFGSTGSYEGTLELEKPAEPTSYELSEIVRRFKFVLSRSSSCKPFLKQQAEDDRADFILGDRGTIHFYDSQAREWKLFSGRTAQFFINQDESLRGPSLSGYNDSRFVISPERIQLARMAKNSRPANQDPESNWGTANQGTLMSLTFEKGTYAAGEKIVARLLMRNISGDAARRVAFWIADTGALYHDIEFQVEDAQGRILTRKDRANPPRTFQERLRYVIQNPKYYEINSGMQRTEEIELNGLFDLESGSYSIFANRSFVDSSGNKYRVSSGRATVTIR